MSDVDTGMSAPQADAPLEVDSQVEGSQDGSAPEEKVAQKAAPKQEAPKSSRKKYNLTVDGRNEDFELDLGNDDEVKKYLQKARAADKRFAESAEIRKAALSFIDELKKNPRKVLSDPNIGIDVKKFAEQVMNEQLAELEKSPEQKEREKLQRELEEIRQQRETEKKSWEQKEFQRMQVEHERQLETDISAALDIGGLPKTPRTVKAMAEMMMIALQNNIDISARDIVPVVKNMTLKEFKEVVNSLGDDQLEDFLGREVIGRLRKRNVAKAKAVETASSIKSTGQSATKKAPEQTPKRMSIRDFLKV